MRIMRHRLPFVHDALEPRARRDPIDRDEPDRGHREQRLEKNRDTLNTPARVTRDRAHVDESFHDRSTARRRRAWVLTDCIWDGICRRFFRMLSP